MSTSLMDVGCGRHLCILMDMLRCLLMVDLEKFIDGFMSIFMVQLKKVYA